MSTDQQRAAIKHNHMTRDIKPLGMCPKCDEQRNRTDRPTTERHFDVARQRAENGRTDR